VIDGSGATPQEERHRITREGLRDGSLLQYARINASPGFPILTDQEIAASLQETLIKRPREDAVWVFGYGSLIWNPAFSFIERRAALLDGWHRRFCLSSGGRGSPEKPGVMLALDHGGFCQGIAFRLEESRMEEELQILWNREMLTGAYRACWLAAQTSEGPITIVAFVANHSHPRFVGDLTDSEIAERIAFARGPMGSNLDYFRNTVETIQQLGLRDANLERVRLDVDAILKNSALG
jgi:glutathione-specific gamma-glutamylcyclotransferase